MAEKLTLARPYAKAAFEYAKEQQQVSVWHQAILDLAGLLNHPDMQQAVSSPLVSTDTLLAIIKKVIGDTVNAKLMNFLRLLAEYHRLELLPEISTLFSKYVAEQDKTVDVEVISAFPIPEELQTKLAGALERRLELSVELHCSVDTELVGGAIIRAGDFVIDGSVLSQLQRLHTNLIS